MRQRSLDSLDKDLIRLLTKDGRRSVGELATELGVTAPTVRTRLHSLNQAGLLRISGLINPDNHDELITALVGINIKSYGKLDSELKKLVAFPEVVWAAVVTGRYDIIAEIVVTGGMAELYRLMTETIPSLGQVTATETFVIMKSSQKWLAIPKALEDW